jgi:hypothetical protein
MSKNNGEVKGREYDGGMVLIPAGVMRLDIPLQAKVIFGAIWALAQMKAHKCYASNWRLADIVGTRPNSRFRRNLKTLQDTGLIERIEDPKHHRDQIRVTWNPELTIEMTPATKSGTPPATKSGTPPATKSGTENLDEKRVEKRSSPLVSSSPSARRRKSDAPAQPVELPPDVEAELTARADAKKAAFAEAARLRKANGQA